MWFLPTVINSFSDLQDIDYNLNFDKDACKTKWRDAQSYISNVFSESANTQANYYPLGENYNK